MHALLIFIKFVIIMIVNDLSSEKKTKQKSFVGLKNYWTIIYGLSVLKSYFFLAKSY